MDDAGSRGNNLFMARESARICANRTGKAWRCYVLVPNAWGQHDTWVQASHVETQPPGWMSYWEIQPDGTEIEVRRPVPEKEA
jgi:hypothetical protein